MSDFVNSSKIYTEDIPCNEISDPAVLAKFPLVSVHMMTYCHEPYIAKAIDGVLQQETDFPFELVIGEDCSTDGTREIVFNYQKTHPDIIRVVTSDTNVGSNQNCKRTTQACRGKYIAFCEGDDYWHHPKKLQMQVDYLEAHTECGMVHSDADLFDVMTGKRIVNHYSILHKQYNHTSTLTGMILNEPVLCTCTVVLRRKLYWEIIRECSYELSDQFFMGDYQTWVEFAYRSEVKFIDTSLATYNILPNSLSHTKDIKKSILFAKNCKDINLHYAEKYGGDDSLELKKIIVSRINNILLHMAFDARDADLAKEIAEDAKTHGASLGIIGSLQLFSCQRNVTARLTRILVLQMRQWRRLLARVK